MFTYDLKLQDKYNICALSKQIDKYVYSARNAEKGRRSLAFSPVSKPHTHITYMLRQCTSIAYLSFANRTKRTVFYWASTYPCNTYLKSY